MEASIATRAQTLSAQAHTQDKETPSIAIAPILCLPPNLRHCIYLHIGVLARYPDDRHAIWNLNGGNSKPSYSSKKPKSKLGFYGLLVCCRTIYAEASALLYGSNRFIIRYREKQSLLPLRNLTPSSISSLTHLKIVLNQSSCHHKNLTWFEDCSEYRLSKRGSDKTSGRENESKTALGSGLHDAPLEIHDSEAKALLHEWRSVAEHLSRHITLQSLELCVVCDVRQDDLRSAREVLEPISLFPELRNCHIRLSKDPTPQLQRMAREAVSKARRVLDAPSTGNMLGLASSNKGEETPQSKPETESRLLTLPRELRFRILGYTDLITPLKEVEWSRDRGNSGTYLALYPKSRILRRLSDPPHLRHGRLFFNCWRASHSKPGVGCFCQVRHSAASSTCMCWAPPTALFLVSRMLLQDAQVVFFSGNRFVVHDFRVLYPWSTPDEPALKAQVDGEDETGNEENEVSGYHSDRLAASIFLRQKVSHQMLRELRELELVFPAYSHTGWPGDGHRALTDWAETLHWARDKMNLGGLTLRLVMTESRGFAPRHQKEITKEQVEEILSAYRRLTSPLSVLVQADANAVVGCDGGAAELRSFHARVTWPGTRSFEYFTHVIGGGRWHGDKYFSRDRGPELSEEAERLVMGQRYNEAYVSGRDPPWKSVWKDRFDDEDDEDDE